MTSISTPRSLADWRSTARFVRWQDHEMAYWQFGVGDDLLLIHGFPTASWDWHQVLPILAQHFRVTAIDLLGFGFSAKPWPHTYRLTEQATMLATVLPELALRDRFSILAHDYGVSVGQQLLTEYPQSIARIVFLNGGIVPSAHRPRLIQKLLASRLGPLLAPLTNQRTLSRNMRAIFGPNTQPDAKMLDDFWTLITANRGKRVMPGLLSYIAERERHEPRWFSAMRQASIPMAYIVGEVDPISGAHMAAALARQVPAVTIHRLPDIGHYPQIEAASDVSRLVLDELDR